MSLNQKPRRVIDRGLVRHPVALVLLTLCLTAGWCAADEPETSKILLIGTPPDHPYGSHMYMFECAVLAKCLEQTPRVEARVHEGWPEDPQLLEDLDAIVFYSHPAGDIIFHPDHRNAFERLMASGVGYVAIHWATRSSHETRPDYLQVLGGWFHRPPCGIKTTEGQLVRLDPQHPISQGWEGFSLHEEFYLDLFFHERAQPLVKVNVDGKDQIVAWAFERPAHEGGRSFGTTLGHFHDNFKLEPFRRLVVNGILWTAHRELPPEGAPVSLPAEALELPPAPSSNQ